MIKANERADRNATEDAIELYQSYLNRKPRDAHALNNLGVALSKLGRYGEAEKRFRDAVGAKSNYPDAHSNLGALLRGRGQLKASESSLRRALKLNANHIDARVGLGLTLLSLGRPADAKPHLERVLRAAPTNTAALLGMGQIASSEGRFEDAESLYKHVTEIQPNEPSAWAALAGLRRMTPADSAWLERAEELVDMSVTPSEEANLRFAIGKYYDDVGEFAKAFQSYKRANDISRSATDGYKRDVHASFVDDLIRVYTSDTISQFSQSQIANSPASDKPVFVVGMPRSGTSLVEQIIASHPEASGAGELTFWTETAHRYEADIRRGPLNDALRKKIADRYLRVLADAVASGPTCHRQNADQRGLSWPDSFGTSESALHIHAPPSY